MSVYNITKEDGATVKIQDPKSRDIVSRVMKKFWMMQRERDQAHPFLRERTLLEYVNDSNMRFNNYRIKPNWKEDWQANISDITTHSKLMAINAQALGGRRVPRFEPRFNRDIYSMVKASLYDNLYRYTDTVERNGEIDDLFAMLRAQRDGTVLQYEDYENNELCQGVDVRFIPIGEAFPGSIREFEMKRQTCFVWRPVMKYYDFEYSHANNKYYQDIGLVKAAGAYSKIEREYFDISADVLEDKVEKVIYWNRIDNEFCIISNGVLITKPGLKLTDIRLDRKIPIAKGVFEPYDNYYFWGRSLPDLMKDNQDAIDFLFNAMFDRELLAVMKPILVGGLQDLTEDFWYPGAIKNVMDVNQIKELGFDGADLNAFRILKELQDRNTFASIDSSGQGIALGRKTATEVDRATQAQQLKNAMFNILYGDYQLQKAELRTATISKYYIKNNKFDPFIIENTKLTDGRMGTRQVEITNQLPARDMFGYSPTLKAKNSTIRGNSEIIQIAAEEMKDFEVKVSISLEPEVSRPMEKAMIRDYVNGRLPIALQRPDLMNAEALLRKEAEIIPGIRWDEVKGEAKPSPLQNIGGPDAEIPSLAAGSGSGMQTAVPNSPL